MSDLQMIIHPDGTGVLHTPRGEKPVSAPNPAETRRQLLQLAVEETRAAGRDLQVTVLAEGRSSEIMVDPFGATRPASPEPMIQSVPGASSTADEVDDEPDLEATVVRPAGGADMIPPPPGPTHAAPAPQAAEASAPSAPPIPSAPSAAPIPSAPSAAPPPSAPSAPSAPAAPAAEQPEVNAWYQPASPAPMPTAPSPAPAPQPADEAQGYPQSAPQQGQGSPQPPQASPQMQQGQPQMQQPQPVQPQPVPQPIPGQPSAPEPAPAHHGIAEDDPEWQRIAQEPATEGSRGSWNRRLGMKLKPSEEELAARRARLAEERSRAEEERRAEAVRQEEEQRASSRREARRRQQEQRRREQREVIQTNFQGARTILIANPKGGARKTTSTYLLAATMGIVRGGSVVAWDANETMGTLGDRSRVGNHTRTVVDLLHDAEGRFSSIEGSRLGALDAFVRPQGDSHFDVLASDEDPTRQDIVDAKGFATVHEILTRFYRLILVDTGNNMRTGHFQAALEAADQLVIPVAASHDSARVAQQMMKALIASGHEELVRSAVVLMHELEPEGSPDGPAVAQELADAFAPQVAEVLPIPFDDALKRGGAIDYAATSESTQNAYLEAATAVARGVQQAAQNREEKSADGDA